MANSSPKNVARRVCEWRIGLINCGSKYLTAERFGFKINATGNSLRKYQIWLIEPDPHDEDGVYLKSNMGRYLSSDKHGKVMCDSEEQHDEAKFTIEVANDGSGRWALKNACHGYFFGGTGDNLHCFSKQVGDAELWTPHLAVHPQVNLRNVNRKRYAHLEEDELHVNELIPWGHDALITLEFKELKYAVRSSNGKYLHRFGQLVPNIDEDCLYTLEYHGGHIALKDRDGKYLTAVGPQGNMVAKNKTVSKDEKFILEDSQPQASFTAHNGKNVSTRQGVDVSANQDELTGKETFQLEFDQTSRHWYIRTNQGKYWSLEAASGIQACSESRSEKCLFEIEWREKGLVAIKSAENGRYVTAKMAGNLCATVDSPTDKELFKFRLMNRPLLVLRGEFGFVDFKSASNEKVECNKSTYDIIQVENGENGAYHLKGGNGKYWCVEEDSSISASGSIPVDFFISLFDDAYFSLKTKDGAYVRGEQSGIFRANGNEVEKATLWEY